jgi:hypothetical protein
MYNARSTATIWAAFLLRALDEPANVYQLGLVRSSKRPRVDSRRRGDGDRQADKAIPEVVETLEGVVRRSWYAAAPGVMASPPKAGSTGRRGCRATKLLNLVNNFFYRR